MQALAGGRAKTNEAAALQKVLEDLKLTQSILDRYADGAADWKPFGGELTIRTLLSNLRSTMIESGAPRFRWNPSDHIWAASQPALDRYVRKLYDEPCVVILDSLSLYEENVRSLSETVLDECLSNESAAVMLLPPTAYTERNYLRDALERIASRLFKQVYREFREAKLPKAQCNLLTPDDLEVSRLLATVVRSSQKHMALRLK
jgi:hypothetical protein